MGRFTNGMEKQDRRSHIQRINDWNGSDAACGPLVPLLLKQAADEAAAKAKAEAEALAEAEREAEAEPEAEELAKAEAEAAADASPTE
jgi:hypothetical protein